MKNGDGKRQMRELGRGGGGKGERKVEMEGDSEQRKVEEGGLTICFLC